MKRSLSARAARRASGLLAGALVIGAGVTCTERGRNPVAPGEPTTVDARVTIEASRDTARMLVGTTLQLASIVLNPVGHQLPNKEHSYWLSSNPAVASVDTSGLVTAIDSGHTFVVAVHKKSADSVRVHVVPVPVARVVITPATLTLEEGKSETLAVATLDSVGGALTGRRIEWSSSATNVATVDAAGIVAAQQEGTAWIRASSEGKSDSARVTVEVPWVISPSTVVLDPATSSALTSSRGTQGLIVDWASSDTSIVRLNYARSIGNYVYALAPGKATVTATIPGTTQTRSVLVTVTGQPVFSITVTPQNAAMLSPAGDYYAQLWYTATLRDREGRALSGRRISWASSDSTVARVSSGTAIGRAVGTAIISATSEGVTGNATLAVLAGPREPASIWLSGDTLVVYREWFGDPFPVFGRAYNAGGLEIPGQVFTWTILDPAIATVQATGRNSAMVYPRYTVGSTRVVATAGGVSDTAVVVVRPRPIDRILIGGGGPLLLWGTGCDEVVGPITYYVAAFDDLGANITNDYPPATWTVTPEFIVNVNPRVGSAVSVSGSLPGVATLTATIGARSASTTVSPQSCSRMTISPTQASVSVGQTVQLNVTLTIDGRGTFRIPPSWPNVTISSSDPSIARVDQNGLVTGVAPGTATVSASGYRNIVNATVTVVP